jgi:hypothetical protein
MKYIILSLFFFINILCKSQDSCVCIKCKENIFIPKSDDESYLYKAKDTLKPSLIISIGLSSKEVGNIKLPNDIRILYNSKNINCKSSLTDVGRVLNIELNYKRKKSNCVTIIIDKSKYHLSFEIKKGYRYLQIYKNESLNCYGFEYSNYPFML